MRQPTREEYDEFIFTKIATNWKWLHPANLLLYIIEEIYEKYLSDKSSVERQETISE